MFEVDLSVFELKGLTLYFFPRLYSFMLGSVQGSETSRILGLCMLELRGYNWTHGYFFCIILNDQTCALPINRCI